MGVVIVAAVKFEMDPLLESLSLEGEEVDWIECGIGAIKPARKSNKLGDKCLGKDVIYVGTCGSFSDFSVPEVIRAEKVLWLPPCVRGNLSWLIEDLDKPIDLPKCPDWAFPFPAKTVICSPSISKSNHIAIDVRRDFYLPDNDYLVENLELYSSVESILDTSRSFVAILGVTNGVGPDGRIQWKQNFKTLAKMTADAIMSARRSSRKKIGPAS
jgi:hypothetical protein